MSAPPGMPLPPGARPLPAGVMLFPPGARPLPPGAFAAPPPGAVRPPMPIPGAPFGVPSAGPVLLPPGARPPVGMPVATPAPAPVAPAAAFYPSSTATGTSVPEPVPQPGMLGLTSQTASLALGPASPNIAAPPVAQQSGPPPQSKRRVYPGQLPASGTGPIGANGMAPYGGGMNGSAALAPMVYAQPQQPQQPSVQPQPPGMQAGGYPQQPQPPGMQAGGYPQQPQQPMQQAGYAPPMQQPMQQAGYAPPMQQQAGYSPQQMQPVPYPTAYGAPQQQQQQMRQQQQMTQQQMQQVQHPQQMTHQQHNQLLQQQEKPRPKIDPNLVPSVVYVQQTDQQVYAVQDYGTRSKQMPPLACTNFVAIDEGNCNPRFIRSTMYNLPLTEDLRKVTHIPMGLIIQPLAELNAGEAPVPVVDFGDRGPVRCQRCKAYINPFMVFGDGGRKFTCNLCQMVNAVPDDYFCNLDASGRRMDLHMRPELRLGSIEFAAPTQDYCTRPPQPASYLFMIDVSYTSVATGVTAVATKAVLDALEHLPPAVDANGEPQRSPVRVAVMTYDRTVHFYNLSPHLSGPQMMVVSDVDDVFVPLSDGLFVDVEESGEVLKTLLTQLPEMFKATQINDSCFGAAITAAKLALTGRGGRVFAVQTILPNVGPGALKQRDDIKLLGTENERQLYMPQDQFYKKVAAECTAQGICVDLFLPTRSYVDLASIGTVTTNTGGSSYYYRNFAATKDGVTLQAELQRAVSRTFGYEGLMRVRTSAGISVTDHIGHFFMQNETDMELGGIDSEKAIGVMLAYDGKLDEKQDACVQCALLYTTSSGQRRIRVHNLSLSCTPLIANVFRFVELDTTLNVMAKKLLQLSATKTLAALRDELTETCIKILGAYRKHCVASTSAGQLILPESLKLMPVYALSLMKNAAFRATDVSFDERVDALRLWKGLGVAASIQHIYPRMYMIDTIVTKPFDDNPELYPAPEVVRLSYELCKPTGVYLLDNGHMHLLWLGANVSQQLLKDLFNTTYLESVDVSMTSLPVLDTPLSKRVHTLIKDLRAQAPGGRVPHLQLVRQREPSEAKLINLLVEDKNNGLMSYVDYLTYMHKQIMNEIAK